MKNSRKLRGVDFGMLDSEVRSPVEFSGFKALNYNFTIELPEAMVCVKGNLLQLFVVP